MFYKIDMRQQITGAALKASFTDHFSLRVYYFVKQWLKLPFKRRLKLGANTCTHVQTIAIARDVIHEKKRTIRIKYLRMLKWNPGSCTRGYPKQLQVKSCVEGSSNGVIYFEARFNY